MNSPAFSETIGSGMNVQTTKRDDGKWDACVPAQPKIGSITAPTEQQAIQDLNKQIASWLMGNRV